MSVVYSAQSLVRLTIIVCRRISFTVLIFVGEPYKVYKKCPQLMSFLFKLCLSCQRNQVIPIYWRIAHEVYIPKNKPPNPSSIKDFRPISLMNVEGKLFFSLVSTICFPYHQKQQVRQCFYSERLYGKDSWLLGAWIR